MIGVCALVGALAAVPIPLRHPADVADVYALRFNPAGLAYLDGAELRFLYGRSSNDARVFTGGAGTDGVALFGGVELLDNLVLAGGFTIDVARGVDHARHSEILGLAYGSDRASVGLTYERFTPFAGGGKDVLSAGVAFRVWSWLALGLSVRDLAQTSDRRQWDIGVGLRPFGERFSFSTRWRLRQSTPLDADTLDLQFLASVEPLDGVTIGATMDVDLDFTGVLALDLERLGFSLGVFEEDGDFSVSTELAYRSERRPPLFSASKVAVLSLAGELVPDPEISILSQTIDVTPYGGVPLALDALARSDRVDGAFIRVGPLDIGWAKAEEIRDAILALRATGRRADCYLTGSTDIAYFVATACETIAVAPPMNLQVDGVAAEVMYFGEGLESLGIDVDVVRRGAYKNSPDAFTRSGMSAEQREALSGYLDTVYGGIVGAIARSRTIEPKEVEALVDVGTLTATEALDRRLVDHILYPDEIDGHLEKLYGTSISPAFGEDAFEPERSRWVGRDQIAIVHVDAEITGGDSTDLPFGLGQTVGARTLVEALERLRADGDVVAVVLRVDSPGGDSFASDLIARAVRRVAEVKPVVASFGDVAASGGYYVAAHSTTIFAEPGTLTGSIGVFAMKVSAEELLAKLGIAASSVERGALSSSGSFAHGQSEAERRAMAKTVDDAYRLFVDAVSSGRRMSRGEVEAVAEGRIWSGKAAKDAGLVDELGGLLDAVRRAKKEAGLEADDPVELVHLPSNRRQLPLALRLVRAMSGAPAPPSVEVIFPHALKRALARISVNALDPLRAPKALAPFVLDVD
jgi:protease-4